MNSQQYLGTPADSSSLGDQLLGILQQKLELEPAHLQQKKVRTGTSLFRAGQEATGLYVLNSGFVKRVRFTNQGTSRIVGIAKPGSVVGLEAMEFGHFDTDAIALTPVMKTFVPLGSVRKMCNISSDFCRLIMSLWTINAREANDWIANFNFGPARQRVLNLILAMRDIHDMQTARLFTRSEMGEMTDLTLETVSRQIQKLTKEGVIEQIDKQGRLYKVNEMEIKTDRTDAATSSPKLTMA